MGKVLGSIPSISILFARFWVVLHRDVDLLGGVVTAVAFLLRTVLRAYQECCCTVTIERPLAFCLSY